MDIAGHRRPWPCAARVERPGHDVPFDKAPSLRQPFSADRMGAPRPVEKTSGVCRVDSDSAVRLLRGWVKAGNAGMPLKKT